MEDRITKLETTVSELSTKMDTVLEQVTLGKHLVQFAKMAGWIIGVLAAVGEVYRSMKGG